MGLALWHDSDLCYMRKVFNIETLGPGVVLLTSFRHAKAS